MLSTIHANISVNSGKISRETNEPIKKPEVIVDYSKTMGGVDLMSRVIIPYNLQRQGVKWYRKRAEFFIELSVYNSFIIFRKLNPENNTMTHLFFRQALNRGTYSVLFVWIKAATDRASWCWCYDLLNDKKKNKKTTLYPHITSNTKQNKSSTKMFMLSQVRNKKRYTLLVFKICGSIMFPWMFWGLSYI